MKKSLLLFFFTIMSYFVSGQTLMLYKSDFKDIFTSDDDKQNFKKLLNYVEKKEKEELSMEYELSNLPISYKKDFDPAVMDSGILHLENFITTNKNNKQVRNLSPELENFISSNFVFVSKNYLDSSYQISDLYRALEQLKNTRNVLNKRDILLKSISSIKDDINDASNKIQSLDTYAKNDYSFKWKMSLIFAILMGVLLYFFFRLLFNAPRDTIAKTFMQSGNGLQFIALFSLILAIILFGILGILEGKELAAILSSISGFILGKGIHNNSTELSSAKNAPPEEDIK